MHACTLVPGCQLLLSACIVIEVHASCSNSAQVQFKGVTLYDCGTKYTPKDYLTNPRCTVVPPSGVQDKLSTPVSGWHRGRVLPAQRGHALVHDDEMKLWCTSDSAHRAPAS